ncbi:CAF17-like 4Fe-4S cluster assembly/insertion protein YgfZ [Comamonas sp. MYb69]|uniref:CAF17-like 4Fe-4S cluster assembly/insertion protein YgfZ n=1 Tax=Comamonas sp. MYb69 TaxID=1848650 RepID=UPI00309B8CE7
MTQALQGHLSLQHLGVIRAEGADAASFLQGQLSHDVQLLPVGQARLAAFLSAKGRMQASFIVIKRSADEFWLLTSRDVLPATLKRLSMFVLRAKCKLSDATEAVQLLGLAGDAVPAEARSLAPWQVLALEDASVVRLYAADGESRALLAAPAGSALPAQATASPAISAEAWQLSMVQAGVPLITTPVVDAFVPQMLNFESVDGVSFKKGCYPGQEVVARSQFRGTLKRRMYRLASAAQPQPGQEVFASSDDSQPVGTVVQAAASASGFEALVSMQIAAASEPLHLGSSTGAALQLLSLPYALKEDI